MATHLRFDGKTGRVEHRTPHGKHTEELLQLNDEATVQYRLGTLRIVHLFTVEIEQQERQLRAIANLLRDGNISQNEHDAEALTLNQELAELRCTMQAQTGDLPLRLLQKKRLSITLLTP